MATVIQIPYVLPPRGEALNWKVQTEFDALVGILQGFNDGTRGWDTLAVGTPSSITGTLKFYTSANSNALSITSATMAAARAYAIPDAGGSADFIMTAGSQTLTGAKTFSATLTMSGATIAMGSQKITGLAAGSTSGDALRYEQLFGGDVTLIGNLIFNPTTKGVKGTTTNDSATAGNIGEVISTAVSATNFPTSNQFGDLTSVTLTAGDWLVSYVIDASANGATVTDIISGVSSTSGNSSTGLTGGSTSIQMDIPTVAHDSPASIPFIHVQLTGSTTYYLKYFATYSVATPKASGRLTGVRIR